MNTLFKIKSLQVPPFRPVPEEPLSSAGNEPIVDEMDDREERNQNEQMDEIAMENVLEQKEENEEKKENLQIKCPICRTMRGDIQDLKLHLKQAHKKNKREIDDIVELGMIEVEPKKPRISYSPAPSESRFSSSSGSPLPIGSYAANNDDSKQVTKLPSSPLMPDSKTAKV